MKNKHILRNKEIELIGESGYLKKNTTVTDALIENFYNEIFKDEEQKLMKMFFEEKPSQKDLDELLKLWDIEVKGGDKSSLLSYFMKEHPELQFTSYEEPRLKGLLNYQKFANLNAITIFTKIGKELNANNIKPLILNSLAIKYLFNEFPRAINNMHLAVLRKNLKKTINIVSKFGYEKLYNDDYVLILQNTIGKKNNIFIHKKLYTGTTKKKKLKFLFKNAKEENIFNVKTFLPKCEDLMFMILINLANNLRNDRSQADILYACFDCNLLIKNNKNFDWNVIIQNAEKTKSKIQVNFALKFISKVSKNILPKEIQENILFEKEMKLYSNMIMFRRFYLEDLKYKCRELKFTDALSSKTKLKEYIKLKPKYQFLRSLRNHPHLIKFIVKDIDKAYSLIESVNEKSK